MNISLFNRKKFTPILQDEYFECGLAALTMCFSYHNLELDLSSLRNKYTISNEGTNLNDLAEIAEKEGFIADCYEADVGELHQLKLPAILHWDLNHFVVVTKITKNKFVISDPAIGIVEYNHEEISKHFTGFAVEITPKVNSDYNDSIDYWKNETKNKSLTLSHFINNTDNFYKTISYVLFITLIIQCISMLIPMFSQVIIDDFIILKTSYNLVYFVLAGLGLIAFRFYANIIKTWSIIFVGYHWHSHFSSYFFKKLLNIPIDYFESRGSSDIYSRFKGLSDLKEALTDKIIEGVIDGIMVIVTFIAMFIYSIKLAMISLTFFIIYAIARYFYFKKEKIINRKEILSKVKEDSFFLETMRTMESVKIYGGQEERFQGWKKLYLNVANYSISISKIKMWYKSLEDVLEGFEYILLLALAAIAVISDSMSLGMMFAFFAYRNIFSLQGKSMIDNIISLKLLSVHLDRLADIENVDEEQNVFGTTDVKNPVLGNITLENICFKYRGKDEYIFKDFSLDIKAGENIVITGKSGSGKTTLLKIIMGLIPIESGRILIDGVDIKQMGLAHYRKYISAVSQKEHLMTESILTNISFFNKPINIDNIHKSSKLACIHDDIMKMNMQYNTISGEMGGNISGGQEQRVLLARALYKKPSILFLDEATSFLDQETEKIIVENIKNLGITRVSIAHRQESIDMADRKIEL
jgi:ATP-binding cassette subfamily B protein RaxB